MRVSKNFLMSELTRTSQPFDNVPSEQEQEKLFLLVNYLVQPIRNVWGKVKVNSAFRGKKVNDAVGSKDTSQHRKGEAIDFTVRGAVSIFDVYHWIVVESGLKFGSCILEYSGKSIWIHLSLMRMNGNNQRALIFDKRKPRGERYIEYDPTKRDKLYKVFK